MYLNSVWLIEYPEMALEKERGEVRLRRRNGESSMKKRVAWIVIGLILAFTIGVEVYKGGEKLPWAIIFAAVVVFFVYSIWRQK